MRMSNVSFIVKVKYQITTSKAVVGVDRPVSAHLRINVEKYHKNCLSSNKVHKAAALLKIIFPK